MFGKIFINSLFIFLFFLFSFKKISLANIYLCEDPETGEIFYSNLIIHKNCKLYLRYSLKNIKNYKRAQLSNSPNLSKFYYHNLQELDSLFEKVASLYELDPYLLKAVAKVESNFNPQAVSPKGAMGIMQLIPSTAELVGVKNPFDPVENIYGGAKYLRYLLDEFKDLSLSLAAYNAGPEKVRFYRGIPPISETQNYVKLVLYYYKLFKNNSRF
ncbi:MAG: lytic transglycosylase domain-containing protein [Thermodesulfobacterium sp.]|nr:lytic transglycosylase domain-containing protein [Thermodesulfobacterium sp.]